MLTRSLMILGLVFILACGASPPEGVDLTISQVAVEKNIVGKDPYCDEWMGCPHPLAAACPAFMTPLCHFADNPTAINYFYSTFTAYGRVCKNPLDGSVIDYVEQDGPMRRVRIYYHKGNIVLFFVHEKIVPDPVCSKGDGSRQIYGELPSWCCT